MTATRSPMDRLLRPRSVAVAGMSTKPGSLGGAVLANLERFAFKGDICLIHPTRSEIAGRRCVPDTSSLPEGIDCVVLAIPAKAILAAVKGCALRKVGGVIIFSGGFAELGDEGRAAQEEIAAISRSAGMVIEGPNCLGMLNYADGVPLTFSATEPRPPSTPGIGLISQSGAMAAAIRAALHGRNLDISFSISTGNEACTGAEDFVNYLLEDSQTRVIVLVAEQFRDPRRFVALAARARELGKPILLLHPGKSAEARQAAETHTGAMTGDYVVMRTVVESHGVLVVDTMEELVDAAEMVVRCKVLPHGGVAVLGESGAFKAMTFDYCAELGLPLPQPTGAAAEAIAVVAPNLIMPSNPLDLTAQPLVDPGIYAKTIEPLLTDARCGSVLVSIILSSDQMARLKMPPVVDVVRHFAPQRAMIFAMLGEDTPIPQEYIDEIRQAGVPFFRSPERALRAIATLSRWKDRGLAVGEPCTSAAERLPTGVIPEYRAKRVLAAAGLPIAAGELAATLAEAQAAAARIGYPVALKAQSESLSHKSDAGGVILGIDSADALAAGWQQLHRNLDKAAPGVSLEGVLVERMGRKGVELIVGAKNDRDWGPVLMIGMGGTAAEAFGDMRVLPVCSSEAQIVDQLRKLKGAALLGAFRGSLAKDLPAVASAVRQLGDFVRSHPEIAEIDINPLVVYPEGQGVLALDALIHVR
ncbi:CoA-binding protein [Georgfuchsia toluolica]|uniref:CoA-binding protein n=1 Tax=Georgfuchsia toluolica TaxID=424218 RepID=A0A916J1K2_9PROT|nr:acetate--CoA ligase family protein [Georgfuchsia toluolica]CAG4882314.1 CoA-binding protein [Georgfuchsia toluolica]